MSNRKISTLTREALWYKDAVIYQLHVKSFADSNNDGVGDFPDRKSACRERVLVAV